MLTLEYLDMRDRGNLDIHSETAQKQVSVHLEQISPW